VGWAFKKIEKPTLASLGKLVWDMVHYTNKLWVNLLLNKYTGGPNILHVNVHNSNSPTWSSIIRAKNILKNWYYWRASSGSSSFWLSNGSSNGFLGTQVPFVDIHDVHLYVKDVITNYGHHTQALYTILPSTIVEYINNTNIYFNASIEDAFIWSHNKNGTYSTKSWYTWLLSLSEIDLDTITHQSWT